MQRKKRNTKAPAKRTVSKANRVRCDKTLDLFPELLMKESLKATLT